MFHLSFVYIYIFIHTHTHEKTLQCHCFWNSKCRNTFKQNGFQKNVHHHTLWGPFGTKTPCSLPVLPAKFWSSPRAVATPRFREAQFPLHQAGEDRPGSAASSASGKVKKMLNGEKNAVNFDGFLLNGVLFFLLVSGKTKKNETKNLAVVEHFFPVKNWSSGSKHSVFFCWGVIYLGKSDVRFPWFRGINSHLFFPIWKNGGFSSSVRWSLFSQQTFS